ncbi:uncharacterized protein CCOS01_04421 [Colletotrichum costaricense]|uniref:Uncharacterized protein n=1 Tax=Colletotrichum costaricense TaxID=1209916 RepID=A0AAI9Z3Z2_9PEZI|nr:uncharacterized protein CCOS01_04421 [Colletotrichum costaricense]KAK1532438.1 hypothetical protein CCOS01_04421 [Colletotrichum costaricense]
MPFDSERSRSEVPSSSTNRTLPGSRRLRRRPGNFSLRVSIQGIALDAASSVGDSGINDSESIATTGTVIRLPDLECYLGQGSMSIECEVDGHFVITPLRPTRTNNTSATSSDAGSLVPSLISRPTHYPSNRSNMSPRESMRGRPRFANSPTLGWEPSRRRFGFHSEPSPASLRSRRMEMFHRDRVHVAAVPSMQVYPEISSVSNSSQRLSVSPITPPPQYPGLVHIAGTESWTSSPEEQQALEATADDFIGMWNSRG